jgi:VWFA-related protein
MNWPCVLLAVIALALPQAQTPVFHGTTDVVLVDVQIVGRDGAPVAELAPAEFSLRVDGKPRPITSVSFQKVSDQAKSLPAAAPPVMSSMPDLSVPTAASYIMFVVDPAVMRPEASRILFDQAAKWMTTMPAEHVVGLTVAPSRSVQHPFSTLRQPIAAELRKQLGSYSGGTYGQAQVMGSLAALEAAIDALRAVDGRRTLVYFSDLIPDYAEENIKDVAFHANTADVAIYVVSSDALTIPTVSSRLADPEPRGGAFGPLPLLADLTGGAFYRRVVTGAMVFDRLERELSAQYVVAFDVQASDRDGKRHKIDVKVIRKGMDVRFRQDFIR